MNRNYSKVRYGLVMFDILCLTYSLWEFSTAKYPIKQGVTSVIECLLGIGLILLPGLVDRFLKVVMSLTIIYFYWFFLFISIFLGTSLHMISIISFRSKILHFVNPILLVAIGYGITGFLLKKTEYADVSPWLFLLLGSAFAGLCGVFREFWEFVCDSLGNMNLQRYNMSNGQPLIGRVALMDTAGGLFTSTLRAFVMGMYTYTRSKGSPEYLENHTIKRKQ